MSVKNYIKSLLFIIVATTITLGFCYECSAKSKKHKKSIPLNNIITSAHRIAKGTIIRAQEYKNFELMLKPTRAGITIRF